MCIGKIEELSSPKFSEKDGKQQGWETHDGLRRQKKR